MCYLTKNFYYYINSLLLYTTLFLSLLCETQVVCDLLLVCLSLPLNLSLNNYSVLVVDFFFHSQSFILCSRNFNPNNLFCFLCYIMFTMSKKCPTIKLMFNFSKSNLILPFKK